MAQLATILESTNIELVLDVGANEGQFAEEIRTFGYRGDIVSFEPLSHPYAALQRKSLSDPLWHLHPRCALGATDGNIRINVAGNSVSSSALPMLDLHRNAAPGSAYKGNETVPMIKLDTVAADYLDSEKNALLKIDTQGYESQVLEGAKDSLSSIAAVMLELSLAPLYEGQALWLDIVDTLLGAGFAIWAVQPVFIAPYTGRTLQVDGIFVRQGLSSTPI